MINGIEYILGGGLERDVQSILEQQKITNKEIQKMSESVQDVDNALVQADTELANVDKNEKAELTLLTQLEADVTALASKVAPDLTNEVNHILAQVQSMKGVETNQVTAEQDIVAADTTAGGTEQVPAS